MSRPRSITPSSSASRCFSFVARSIVTGNTLATAPRRIANRRAINGALRALLTPVQRVPRGFPFGFSGGGRALSRRHAYRRRDARARAPDGGGPVTGLRATRICRCRGRERRRSRQKRPRSVRPARRKPSAFPSELSPPVPTAPTEQEVEEHPCAEAEGTANITSEAAITAPKTIRLAMSSPPVT
jgi:hypothetical protein